MATFAGCKITGTAGSYTLTASSTGLTSATTSAFTITFGTATQLVVTTQPNGGANGVAWTTQPVVTVEDASGNTVTARPPRSPWPSPPSRVAVPPSPAPEACPRRRSTAWPPSPAVRSSGKIGSYTLTASSTGLTSATTNAFTITVGTATQLAVTTQPNGGANGVAWTSQPVVTVEDSGGNTVTTATNTVTLAIATQPGSGATLACTTNPVTAVNGVATFTGCQIVGKAGSYTVTASTAGLTSATTSAFTLTFGAATQLVFTTQPNGGANGAAWTSQPVVTVEDSGGNTVTSSSASVTLAIATQPGSGATLGCTGGLSKAASTAWPPSPVVRSLGKVGQLHPHRLLERPDLGHHQRLHHHLR